MTALIATIAACGGSRTGSSPAPTDSRSSQPSTTSSPTASSEPARLYLRPVLCAAPPYNLPPGAPPAAPSGPPPPCAAPAGAGEAAPLDQALATVPSTPPELDDPKAVVLLPQKDTAGHATARYELGPAVLGSSDVQSAFAAVPQNGGAWQVNFTLTGAGSAKLDAVAVQYYRR